MAFPKRRGEFDEPNRESTDRPQAPVLVEDETSAKTEPGAALQPPRRVPPEVPEPLTALIQIPMSHVSPTIRQNLRIRFLRT